MSMSKFASKFDYLLNAFEQASQSQNPAAEGYADKRRALLEYVRKLEAARPEGGQTDHPPVAWRWRNQGGQWWYSETPPLNGSNYIEENAEIEPLYRPRDQSQPQKERE